MYLRSPVLSAAVLMWCATVAFGQAPTPTPVDSNVAVTSAAQSIGNPCTSQGGDGCGGCYPAPIPGADPTTELAKVDPEWSAIGTMTGVDPSIPPQSQPVLLKGTVALTKINVPHEGYIYPKANHGFHNDTTPRYDEAAAKLAWQRTIDWFNKYLRST